MYQAINNATPEAFITRKKSRAKIYQSNVIYLNDGDTFEIELFNPKTKRVLSKIWLNGVEISGSGIIINPGQRIFLERFIDTSNKFVFNTYEVENTPQSVDAIRKNGDVTVKFYDEYYLPDYYIPYNTNTFWYETNPLKPYTYRYFGDSSITTTSNITNISYTNTTSKNLNTTSVKSIDNVETGIINKGEVSNQTFTNAYGSFLNYRTNEITYKISPYSLKPIEGKDLKKYCSCGKKVKESFKFCPNCGSKV